jgi:hypothetical protein
LAAGIFLIGKWLAKVVAQFVDVFQVFRKFGFDGWMAVT